MSPHTVELHRQLIRLLKGCLAAWEKWLDQTTKSTPARGTQT